MQGFRAILDKAGVFTYRFSTEQLFFMFKSSHRRGQNSSLLLRAAQAVAAASDNSSPVPAWWCLRQGSRGGLVQLSPICKTKRKRKHVVCLDRNVVQCEPAEIPPPFIPKPARGRRDSREER